ncbi:SDR family oxidoreductase, partial [bacterium]|nr:SDR family oxidoreductase [bacterium]
KDEASTSILRNMTGHYERSKFLAENIIHKYANQGLKAVILRPAAIIGPGDPGNTPGTALIRRLLNLRIPFYYRSGLNLIDVRDVAEGHLAALDKGESGKTYILSGNNIGFDSLLAELNQIVKTDVKLKHINYHLVLALSYLLEFSSYLTRKEPLFTRGAIKTIKHPWYFNNDQTKKALKINPRPLIESLKNTVDFLKTSAERMSKD